MHLTIYAPCMHHMCTYCAQKSTIFASYMHHVCTWPSSTYFALLRLHLNLHQVQQYLFRSYIYILLCSPAHLHTCSPDTCSPACHLSKKQSHWCNLGWVRKNERSLNVFNCYLDVVSWRYLFLVGTSRTIPLKNAGFLMTKLTANIPPIEWPQLENSDSILKLLLIWLLWSFFHRIEMWIPHCGRIDLKQGII